MYKTVIIALGKFGSAVASHFEEPDTFVWFGQPRDVDVSILPVADVYILIAGHSCPRLEMHLCEYVNSWGKIFVPVVHEHPYLRTGPITHPASMACSSCYWARIRQHTIDNKVYDAMSEEYIERGDEMLPVGILPIWVDLTVGLLRWRLKCDPGCDPMDARKMLGLDLMSGAIVQSDVIGINGCKICDVKRSDPLDWSVSGLASIISGELGVKNAEVK